MRFLSCIALVLFSFHASAGCDEFAFLRTPHLYLEITDGGCGPETVIRFTKNILKNGSPDWETMQTLSFYQECSLTEKTIGFHCKKEGRSPLAGATYEVMKRGKSRCPDEKNEPRYLYVCTRGCTKGVPKHLNFLNECS